MFDYRKIEAFCKVCEQGSFSKAGEVLFLSQPTVSAHVQSLERDFEVRLLDRMGRTVQPTPAGAVLYRYAKQAMARLEAAKAEISALTMEVSGELRLGCSVVPAHHLLPEVLVRFSTLHPKALPLLTIASSSSVIKDIWDGSLMAGVVGREPDISYELTATPLFESEMVIIAPPGLDMPRFSPQADGSLPHISFDQACALPWIVREESSSTRRLFEKAVRAAGYDPRLLQPHLVVDSSQAAVEYVRAGLGVTPTVRIAVEDAIANGELQAFSIRKVRVGRRFFYITNARRLPFPAETVFFELLCSCIAEKQLPQHGSFDDI